MTLETDSREMAVRFATFPLNSWANRISETALAHFVQACQKQLLITLAADEMQKRPMGRVFQCSIALLPSTECRVEVQSRLQSKRLEQLISEALRSVPTPVVRQGAVGLVIAVELFGGATTEVRFERPFSTLPDPVGDWANELSTGPPPPQNSGWLERWKLRLARQLNRLASVFGWRRRPADRQFEPPAAIGAESARPVELRDLTQEEATAAVRQADLNQLRRWTKQCPMYLEPWLELGERELASDNHERSLKFCDALIRRFPQRARVFDLRGAAHFLSGQRQAALADFNRALELDRNSAAGYVRRGILYLDLEAFARREAISRPPSKWRPWKPTIMCSAQDMVRRRESGRIHRRLG